jgi:hypothetical protein
MKPTFLGTRGEFPGVLPWCSGRETLVFLVEIFGDAFRSRQIGISGNVRHRRRLSHLLPSTDAVTSELRESLEQTERDLRWSASGSFADIYGKPLDMRSEALSGALSIPIATIGIQRRVRPSRRCGRTAS